METLSNHDRARQLKSHYDVIVVGGGIYGATVLWESISRGLSVLLVEGGDFGSGTSANSLKTIHGGLRSLQRFDFREMREYIRERRTLLKIAPHLVTPMTCVMPTSPALSKSKLFLGAGLKFYDLIAYDRNRGLDKARQMTACQIISRERFNEFVPELGIGKITGGACWNDAQAYNSERLILAFIMSAVQAGADACNYMKKKEYIIDQGKVTGVIAEDGLSGEQLEITAQAVIDCSGPWVAKDLQFNNHVKQKAKSAVMARAVNLVVDRELTTCALGVMSQTGLEDSGRLLFIAPWRQGSIIGTWYYSETASPENLTLSANELTNCLAQVNSVFPSLNLNRDDVTLFHIGMQPADQAAIGSVEPRVWRHSKIIEHGSGGALQGLYWVQGVKLTTARATAEAVVDKVKKYIGGPVRPSRTDQMALYGGDISDCEEFEQRYRQQLAEQFSSDAITRLIRNYGSNLDSIMGLCDHDQSLAQLVPGTTDTIKAEVDYVLEHEMAYTLSDLILRRTDIGSLACPSAETIDYCADTMASFFSWDQSVRSNNIDALLKHYPEWHRN